MTPIVTELRGRHENGIVMPGEFLPGEPRYGTDRWRLRFHRFYLVSQQDKGQFWVRAQSYSQARTIFRAIEPKTARGTTVHIEPIRRLWLAHGTPFWERLEGEIVERRYHDGDRCPVGFH